MKQKLEHAKEFIIRQINEPDGPENGAAQAAIIVIAIILPVVIAFVIAISLA